MVLVKLGQLRSNSVKPSKTSRNVLHAMFWETLNAFGSLSDQTWLSLGCLILRADTWENPEDKNRVMTVMADVKS